MSDYSEDFERFWQAYPVSNRKGKMAAFTSWKKHVKADQREEVVNHLRRRNGNDEQWNRGYIPLPTTFLNQHRWDDSWKQDPKVRPKRAQGALEDHEPEPEVDIQLSQHLATLSKIDAVRDKAIDLGYSMAWAKVAEIAELYQYISERLSADELRAWRRSRNL